MNKICRIGIAGVGQRGCAYVKLALDTPGAELTALCDVNPERLHDFAVKLNCETVPQFTDPEAMLDSGLVDAVIITVPDFEHTTVAQAVLRHGKHLMLEKPMAPTAEECRKIIAAHAQSHSVMQLGFVLREHPLYKQIKKIVESGRLGQLMSVAADEALGVMHGASYMRRWHRKIENSGGFMLAKCSHDLDLLSWIIDSVPVKAASFGGINFFTPDKQKAAHCSECPDTGCRFRFKGEMVVMSSAESAAPSQRHFDLCVYNNDKNIVDNQVAILEYANGVRATFSLNLFAPEAKRSIKITGSEGYLEADTLNCRIRLTSSLGRPEEIIECKVENDSGHGGSDRTFFEEFLHCIQTGDAPKADYRAGLASTLIGNALEKARLTGQTVTIPLADYQL